MKTQIYAALVSALLLGAACSSSQEDSSNLNYADEIRRWHSERIASLKKEDGWLNLAGLFWLREGSNSVGSDKNSDVIFPKDKAAAKIGTFLLENGKVRFTADPTAIVTVEGTRITDSLIFSEGQKKPTILAHGSLRWFIIKRGNRYGVRLRDLEHEAVKSFSGIPTYDIDPRWRIRARMEPASDTHKIAINDVLGQVSYQPSPGTLVFDWQGTTYRLDAVESGDKLFILFADETNKRQTYAAGRFLYADRPDSTGYTILDFNKAINPPCAFTEFATCPLPPPQNRLALAVKAGEKRYNKGH
jgi:uncharacterized protein (DUF1684 family)